jgi:type I restriction enzyme S subunit
MSEDELPEGWAATTIRESFDCWGGMTPSTGTLAFWGGTTPWVSSKDVKGDRIDGGTEFVTARALDETRLRKCRPGTVLVVVRSGVLVHTLPVAITDSEVVINQDLKAIDSGDDLINGWLALALKAQASEILEASRKDGTTVQSVRVDQLLDRGLPIPPLAEQRRIVEKVEALLAQVNAARARLAKVPTILKRFRQSILSAACSGHLTEDWRRRHLDLPDPASLLARRRAQETTKTPDADALPDIPQSWAWAFLPELGELNRGKSRHRPRNDPRLYGGAYPFIQTGDVARSGGRISTHGQTYNDAGLAQSRLWPAGTVCITIAANIADSGILAYPACFPDSVVGFAADPEIAVGEYVEFFVRTARQDLAQFAPATAQANINLEILREVAVPFPPLPEQREIVHRVDALFKLADTVEARLAAATARTDKLTQAILAKAFRGKLVPTEAELARQEGRDYEPASALLARIRAERAASKAAANPVTRIRRADARATSTAKPPRPKTTNSRTARSS